MVKKNMEQQLLTEKSLKLKIDEAFKEANNIKLNESQATIIFNKLKRHYKLRYAYLSFTNRLSRHYGLCSPNGHIRVRRETNLNTLCHEITHSIAFHKHKRDRHTKSFYKRVGRVCYYCIKHNCWQDEINRRLEPKPIKAITKEQIQNTKIEKAKEKIKRYESKVKMYSKKLSKAKRSLKMLERYKDEKRTIC